MRDRPFFQLLSRNLGWMAASLFLAIVVWVAANMSNNPLEQREIDNIRIDINLPEGYVLARSPNPSLASALVRAPQNDWNLLVREDIEIVADLSHIREPGEYRIELDGDVRSPLHGSVVAIRPSTLTLQVDAEAEKRVAVRVVVSEEPPLGYTYASDPSCDQTEVAVRGSAERVERVDHAEVRLRLGDVRNPIVDNTYSISAVQQNGNTVSNVEIEPATVICSVDIQPREDVFQLRVVPNIVGDPPEGYIFDGSVVVDPPTVSVTGSRSELSGVVYTSPIDLTDRRNSFTSEVQLVGLPSGVTLIPENQVIRVTVTITALPTSRRFDQVKVEIEGLDLTMFHVSGLPDTVTVTVVGPPDQLPEQEDIRVYVDLSNREPGNHPVELQASIVGEEVPNGAITINVLPRELNVTIEAINLTPTPSPTVPAAPETDLDATPSDTSRSTGPEATATPSLNAIWAE